MKLHLSFIGWITAGMLFFGSLLPEPNLDLVRSVLSELLKLLPLIVFVAVLAGWLAVSALADRLRGVMNNRPWRAILAASLVGTITPVCGIASVPLVAALLRQGVPMAAAMAFWLSSPITDPGMLILTAGILGWPFAIGKLAAAFLLGLSAGALTQGLYRWNSGVSWVREGALSDNECSAVAVDDNRSRFIAQGLNTFWLVMRWLAFALTIEALVRFHLGEAGFILLAGVDPVWAVPMAVVIGGPLYIEGYAALPLLRGLIDMGLAPGAAMSFLISGAAISLYSAIAVWSLVRPMIFGLYLLLGIIGALVAGWVMEIARYWS